MCAHTGWGVRGALMGGTALWRRKLGNQVQPGVVTHTVNPSLKETEAGRPLWLQGLSSLHSEFQASQEGLNTESCLNKPEQHVHARTHTHRTLSLLPVHPC